MIGASGPLGLEEVANDMTKLQALKDRFMEDAEFRKEYARADEEYALVEAQVWARTAAKLTQAELARRRGTTQWAIAGLKEGRGSRRDVESR